MCYIAIVVAKRSVRHGNDRVAAVISVNANHVVNMILAVLVEERLVAAEVVPNDTFADDHVWII